MRRLVLLLPIFLIAAVTLAGERHFSKNESSLISAEPIALDSHDPARGSVGRLAYLGGWVLASTNSDFGGFSALSRLPDGRFLAITDTGRMAAFRLIGDATEARIEDSFIAPLPGATGAAPDGSKLEYEDRDSESITASADFSHYWVGYENRGAIRRFGSDFARVSALVRPAEMDKWPVNGGAEALTRLSDGRFIAFSEAASAKGGGTQALIFSGDPTAKDTRVDRFSYQSPDGYRITDAAELPDGRLILLHRDLSFPDGFTAIIAIADARDILPGARLSSEPIARLEPPVTVDNMEGILVEQEADRTIIWLISDDNNLIFQRTLLLKFALDLPAQQPEISKKADNSPRPGFSSQ